MADKPKAGLYVPSSLIPTECKGCGERFFSHKTRVPGARTGTEKWGPAEDRCGVCKPRLAEIDWGAVPKYNARAQDE